MKKLIFLAIFAIAAAAPTWAGEGMWLPFLLQKMNEAQMKSMGMKMNAEDIYSLNKGSLKDAVVQFGGGCTGEIISDKGLLLTNHHCGYGAIQDHTTLETNYLRDGFWAKTLDQELPNPGLTALFIVRMEDVTAAATAGIMDNISEKERQSQIDKNLEKISKSTTKEPYQDILIRPFFEGNNYYLFVTETFKDVRLVGTPPSSIGKFGSDTDNWVFPRHTGDFSMFRIYADKDNRPAAYSKENVPFKPRHFLPISLDGVAEGDFTLVMGFPGRTNEYLPAAAVEQTLNTLNPVKIGVRDRALKVMDEAMRKDEQIKIQYSAKYASIANYWKKWLGESLGLKKCDGVGKKQQYEADFIKKLNAQPELKVQYGSVLDQLNLNYKLLKPYAFTRDYFSEVTRNTEILSLVNTMSGLVKVAENNGEKGFADKKTKTIEGLKDFFKDYNADVDKKIFAGLVEMYFKNVNPDYIGDVALKQVKKYEQNFLKLADNLYQKTILTQPEKLISLIEKSNSSDFVTKIKNDAAYQFGKSLMDGYIEKVDAKIREIQPEINRLQRKYLKAQMTVFAADKTFYPDANSTLRVTYGQVEPYQPRDGVTYNYYTYLDGVMEKYIPNDYEFDVPEKLRKLFDKKDYGIYADQNGKMPVCFIGSNHTTGGNSGSPAIDAYGNLVGLNFDRVWEGTMSDINYDRSICRNIMVDARYVLFIVDKFANASHLVTEMKLVHPKKK